jgi:MFS transporter, SP family, galactose:H+ symporter
MVYVGAFAVSLGPIFWLLISEIYPLRVRGLAAGVATRRTGPSICWFR